jgi:hypothetical protein
VPAVVQLRLDGPRGAQVFLDDRFVGTMPLALHLDKQARPRQLRIHAPGYAPFAQTIAGDMDHASVVRMHKLERSSSPPLDPKLSDPFRRSK